ncbi:MAG TPA: glycerophosphodiester phosphodiesterase [Gemmatimonadaceae bacterium]|nr:glycerophosphodiester phosphodiesterase [Gemmatimonadaceae bacterium]
MRAVRTVERIAHRGAKREFPENTLSSFQRAFELGADAVELDVHATRDGVVVVHHDPTLGRDGPAIRELTWPELTTRTEAAVPRLSDVLEAIPASATVYVEIKALGIEKAVSEALAKVPVRCAVHSFDHATIVRMREVAPKVARGVLFDGSITALNDVLSRSAARDVWPQWELIDQALVNRVHAQGCRVIAWTVNTREEARRLAALGVDGICSDDVRLLEEL